MKQIDRSGYVISAVHMEMDNGRKIPDHKYWDAGDIYRLFERDIKEIQRGMAFKIPRIRSYEADEIRYAYAPYYHGMAKEFIRDMIAEIAGAGDDPAETEEQEQEIAFLDIVNSPIFMVTKEFANLIRIYCPATKFKSVSERRNV